MKSLSERMTKTGTEQRIRTPAIWTILKDYGVEVEQLEAIREAAKTVSDMHFLRTLPEDLTHDIASGYYTEYLEAHKVLVDALKGGE